MHGRIEGAAAHCAVPGCGELGEFRAPLTPGDFDGPGAYRWMCLDHVREHNTTYNYFNGMSPEEIADAQSPYSGWSRSTRAFSMSGADPAPAWSDFTDPLDAIGARYRPDRVRGRVDRFTAILSGRERMRKLFEAAVVTLALLSAAACSRADERASDEFASSDARETSTDLQDAAAERAAPGIVPTAAPGVAFAYHYGFRMPDASISAAQEVHAAACEKLGLTKCRITGMTYELDDRDRVDGTLEIAIDPLLARGFGRDAIATVEKHEGKLRYARISGEDQNPVLDEAARREGNANRTIAQLEADLAKAKDENERVQLREQIRQLRADIEAAQSASAQSEAKIQRTPMTFTYRGGAASRGFAGENPATEAWYLFIDSAATLVSVVLKVLAVVLPWLVLVLLLVIGWRSRLFDPVRRAWGSRADQRPKE